MSDHLGAIDAPFPRAICDHVRALAFSPDGRHLATAGDDGVLRLWSLHDRKVVVAVVIPEAEPAVLALRWTSRRLTLCTSVATWLAPPWPWPRQFTRAPPAAREPRRRWSAEHGRLRYRVGPEWRERAGVPSFVCGFAVSRDGSLLVVASEGRVQGFGPSGAPLWELPRVAECVDVRATATRAHVLVRELGVAVWGLSGELRSFWPMPRAAASGDLVALVGDQSVLVRSATSLERWNIRDDAVEARLAADEECFGRVAVDGECVAAVTGRAESGFRLRLWTGVDRPEVAVGVPRRAIGLGVHASGVAVVRDHQGGIVLRSDGAVTRFPVEDGEWSRVEIEPLTQCYRVADRYVATYDLATGARRRPGVQLPTDGCTGVATSPDGARHACGFAYTRPIAMWKEGEVRAWSMEGHRGPVACVRFTPDGRRLVSAGADGQVCIWSTRTRRRLAVCEAFVLR